MFTFCIQRDTIRVEPRDFGKEPAVAIKEEIHRRYANKVLPDVGLCISLLDILDASEGAVLYGDGCYYYKTEFRLIVFRPFVGEALVGSVRSQSELGITVSLGFFDDILIPPNLLPDHSAFDPKRQSFFWLPPTSASPEPGAESDEPTAAVVAPPPTALELLKSPTSQRMYIEKRDFVKVRIEEEHWDDSGPLTGKADAPLAVGEVAVPKKAGKAPYRLIASMTEQGTGLLDWWDAGDEEEEQEGEEEG